MNKFLLLIVLLMFFYFTNKAQSVDYPGAISKWVPSCNTGGSRSTSAIDTWVNHWIGEGTYLGSISWFLSCPGSGIGQRGYISGTNTLYGATSAHFIINTNGEVTQLVPVNIIAYHAGATGYNNNTRSIGVEHAVTASDPSKWNNSILLKASVDLASYFCNKFNIPKVYSLPGIRGHKDMPGTSTQCPGTLPWTTWMNMLSGSTTSAPSNDNPCDAGVPTLSVGSSCSFTQGTNVGATNSSVSNVTCDGTSNGDVWYKLIVPSSGNVTIETNAGTINDMGMAIYSGSCSSLSYIGCYANGSSYSSYMPKAVLTGLTPNSTLWIRLWEYNNNNFGTFSICATSVGSSNCTITSFNLSSITRNPESFSSSSGDDIIINGQPNCSFSVSESCSWLTVTPTSGTTNSVGQAFLNYSLQANTSTSPRSCTVTVNGSTFTILQNGCTYDFYPTAKSLSASGSTYNLEIDSYSSCSWSIQNSNSWVHLSQTSGTGYPTISVAVDANSSSESRTGTITIVPGNKTHVITQQGIDAILNISSTNLTLGSASNSSDQINVTSNVNWTASNDATWLSISPASSSNNGTVTVSATSANTSSSSRSGTVTISGSGIIRNVTVTQSGVTTSTITASITSLPDFGSMQVGTNSSPQIFTVSGSNLTSNIAITAPTGFQISTSSGSGFTSSITLTQSGGTVSSTTIYTRFSPTSTGLQSGNITLTSTSAATKNVSISGNGTPNVAVATLTIGNTSGSAGNTISIPVSVTDFLDVVAFQFTIVYDKNKLDYVSCSNWAAGTNVSDVQVNPLISDGKITFVYNNSAINITAGKFFDINFTVKSNVTGMSVFSWSDTPTKKEISNSQSQEVPGNYGDGTLTIVSGYNLTGQLVYENTAQTPLSNIPISLFNSNSQSAGTSTTDATGSFSFSGLSNGNYTLKPDVKVAWGGASAMDITSYKKHIGNVSTLSQIQVKSGDVNGSNSLTSMDLTIIKQRIGAQISSFTVGDWVYDPVTAIINGTNLVQNIKALCYGDANGSYTISSLKSFSNVFLANKEKINQLKNGELEIPLMLNKAVDKLSSVTLAINYPAELFDVKDIKMIDNNEDLYYSVKDGKINVIYSTLNSLNLKEGDLLMTILFSLKKDASHIIQNNKQLEFSGSGEFGDYDDKILDDVKLSYSTFDFNSIINEFEKDEINVYPNPATNFLTVTNVNDTKIEVLDMLGRSILSKNCQSNSIELDIHILLPGTYTLKVNKNNKTIYKKFTVVK